VLLRSAKSKESKPNRCHYNAHQAQSSITPIYKLDCYRIASRRRTSAKIARFGRSKKIKAKLIAPSTLISHSLRTLSIHARKVIKREDVSSCLAKKEKIYLYKIFPLTMPLLLNAMRDQLFMPKRRASFLLKTTKKGKF
jgi:hypothetical protein